MINRYSFLWIIILLVISPLTTLSQTAKNKASQSGPPALSAIREEDLKKDLFAMTSDHFRGREAGTLDELKVSMWLADKLRAIGIKPAGDDGTYFQFFSMWRNRIANNSSISIGDRSLQLWKDVLIAQTAPATVSAPIVFVGNASKADLEKADIKGKAVAVQVSPEGINLNVSLPERRYPGYVLRKYGNDLLERGATAIIFISDAMGEKSWSQVVPALSRGLYDIEGGPNAVATIKAPVIWLHDDALSWVKSGATLNAVINIERFEYPSVNIVGKIDGTDPALAKEYVLFSGHQDHDGVRQPYGTDSIYNGADDNASVSVAMMAIARAFKKAPGRRSVLFVWHGAEERGLLGSKWFSAHPTVPEESIVAVLNGDMIGRNHPDSAALLGVQPPHRNSAELVAMALEAHKEGSYFKLDSLRNKVEHVEGW